MEGETTLSVKSPHQKEKSSHLPYNQKTPK